MPDRRAQSGEAAGLQCSQAPLSRVVVTIIESLDAQETDPIPSPGLEPKPCDSIAEFFQRRDHARGDLSLVVEDSSPLLGVAGRTCHIEQNDHAEIMGSPTFLLVDALIAHTPGGAIYDAVNECSDVERIPVGLAAVAVMSQTKPREFTPQARVEA